MARGRYKPPFEQFVEPYLFQLSDQRCAEITLRWRRYHLVKPVNGPRSGRRRRTPPTGSETASIGSSSAAISPRSAARRLRVAGRGGRRRSRAYSPPSAPSAAGFTRKVCSRQVSWPGRAAHGCPRRSRRRSRPMDGSRERYEVIVVWTGRPAERPRTALSQLFSTACSAAAPMIGVSGAVNAAG